MKRKAAWTAALSLVLGGILAPSASAGTYLGQYSAGTAYCLEDQAYAQESIGGGNAYQATAYGVITYWAAPPTPEPGHTLQLVVFQRRYPASGVGHFFTAVRKDVIRSQITGDFSDYYGLRIPIEAGQEVGLYVPPGQPVVDFGGGVMEPVGVCLFSAAGAANRYRTRAGDPPLGTELDYTTSGANFRLNVWVYVEPDADRDGFGDETQDRCRTDASTQSFCPVATAAPRPVTTTPKRRKCKRRRKAGQRSAVFAKRKRCRRKKR